MSNSNSSGDRWLRLADGTILRPCDKNELHTAVQLVLSTPEGLPAEAQVVDFLRHAMRRRMDLSHLWVAEQRRRLVWAVLPVVSPGRTMLLFAPGLPINQTREAAARELLQQVCLEQSGLGVDLAQVLLAPEDGASQARFEASEFITLGELMYLQGRVRRRPVEPVVPGARWLRYERQTHPVFVRAILSSYEQSLDCPALTGRRSIDDVIAGHKAAGQFHPEHWFVLVLDDEPAGVVLLNCTPGTEAVELVYLGLSPRFRGRGLGDVLMQRAQHTAAAAGCRQIALAVDAQNRPALKLYYRHGLGWVCNRVAMLRDLLALRGSSAEPSAARVHPPHFIHRPDNPVHES
jgi:mycothiol synthase